MKNFRTFDIAANRVARAVASPVSTFMAIIAVLVLTCAGPFYHFNAHWQLVINTFTTIVTFLMVFLIQHTQNGDTAALHIKLDELIRALDSADTSLLDLEHAEQGQIESLRTSYHDMAQKERGGASHTEHAQKKRASDDDATP